MQRIPVLFALLAGAALTSCVGGSGPIGASTTASKSLPETGDFLITARNTTSGNTVILESPSEGLGVVKDAHWENRLGHFSQQQYSQALGFPPNTEITITNVSPTLTHTLDVVGKVSGPPARFPTKDHFQQRGPSKGPLRVGWSSGWLYPMQSVTVRLVKPGNYLIGCRFHYTHGWKDVLVVAPGATPGPQATPPAR
jgi:hypothetical protein